MNDKRPKVSKSVANMALLQQQIDELTAAVQRERADATNLRRHHDAQITALKTVAKANVVRELLPVIDSFERALQHVPKELADSDFIKGIEGIVKQFEKTLAELGVERIKTVGAPFDPRWHEAVAVEDEDGGTQELVSAELQAGYKMGDEIIRHAMVKVRMS